MTVNGLTPVSELVQRLKQGDVPVRDIPSLALATASKQVRNAAVIALVDRCAPGAAETMLTLLARADTRGDRGTILYALSKTGAHVPLPLLVTMIQKETYEAQEEALGLLDHADYNEGERNQAVHELSAFRSQHMKDAHLRELAEAAIDYLLAHQRPSFRF
jgi:HEAT repeat protein